MSGKRCEVMWAKACSSVYSEGRHARRYSFLHDCVVIASCFGPLPVLSGKKCDAFDLSAHWNNFCFLVLSNSYDAAKRKRQITIDFRLQCHHYSAVQCECLQVRCLFVILCLSSRQRRERIKMLINDPDHNKISRLIWDPCAAYVFQHLPSR